MPAGQITAAEARAEVFGTLGKVMGFTRTRKPNLPNDRLPKLYIFSVNPYTTFEWALPSFPKMVVPKCEKGKKVSEPLVVDGMYSEEVLLDRKTEHYIYSGEEIAGDIMKKAPGIAPSLNREQYGCFISDVNPPREKDIAAATAKLVRHMEAVLLEADAAFAAGRIKDINEESRWASEYLAQPRDYAKAHVRMVECPICFKPVNEQAAVHFGHDGCGAVINWPKAIQSGLKKFDDVPESMQEEVAKQLGIKRKQTA